jgi:23S rRNA (uracil1939-C5)-methyltransferase
MTRKKKQLPILENITITDVAAEGKAIAKVDGLTVFVPYVVPGDVVDIQLGRKKNSYAEGKAIKFHSYSPERTEAFCAHFGVCGGCKWQVLPYNKQLEYKQKQVTDNLTRIGKIEFPSPLNPPQEDLPNGGLQNAKNDGSLQSPPKGDLGGYILGAPETTFYRNKLEFTFSNKKWLTEAQIKSNETFSNMNAVGFHIPGMFDKVLDIEKCWLQSDISNQIRNAIRTFCLENNYSFFDLRNQHGLMRTLIIRTSSIGEIMAIVVFYENDKEKHEKLLTYLAETFPQITSLLYIINQKANDTITDQQVIVWKGRDHIFEEMEGLRFKIGAKSFYQTNSEQAYNLYKITRDFAQLSGNELVYDLYTGTGTIANFIARSVKKVIGIEYVPEAIEDAKENSRINGIENTLFFAGDMKNVLNADFIAEHGRPDVIITDPPRAGMHNDVIETILFAEPQRIVYVSCNPATQARDLSLLNEKYQVARVQPVDMFPHTHHVENVVLLEKCANK